MKQNNIINLKNTTVTFERCDMEEIQEITHKINSINPSTDFTCEFDVDVNEEVMKKMLSFFKENKVPTLKEQFFKRFFPNIIDIEKWYVVVPENMEILGVLWNESWIKHNRYAETILAVKINNYVIPNISVNLTP